MERLKIMSTSTDVAKSKPIKLGAIVLPLFLLCSLFFNLLLSRKVASLKEFVQILRTERQLKTGDLLPSFIAKDVSGSPGVVDYRGHNKPTVLYIFVPDCDACQRNLPNIKALSNDTREAYRFVGLSLTSDKLADYVRQNNFAFPVYTELPFFTTSTYKLGGTPQTIIVSQEGRVLKNWMGSYEGTLEQEVEDFFQIQLPGVSQP
jgi:peroxiredoxin